MNETQANDIWPLQENPDFDSFITNEQGTFSTPQASSKQPRVVFQS